MNPTIKQYNQFFVDYEDMIGETIKDIYYDHNGTLFIRFETDTIAILESFEEYGDVGVMFGERMTPYAEWKLGFVSQSEYEQYHLSKKVWEKQRQKDAEYLRYQELKRKYEGI